LGDMTIPLAEVESRKEEIVTWITENKRFNVKMSEANSVNNYAYNDWLADNGIIYTNARAFQATGSSFIQPSLEFGPIESEDRKPLPKKTAKPKAKPKAAPKKAVEEAPGTEGKTESALMKDAESFLDEIGFFGGGEVEATTKTESENKEDVNSTVDNMLKGFETADEFNLSGFTLVEDESVSNEDKTCGGSIF